jgi:hypothetical protein
VCRPSDWLVTTAGTCSPLSHWAVGYQEAPSSAGDLPDGARTERVDLLGSASLGKRSGQWHRPNDMAALLAGHRVITGLRDTFMPHVLVVGVLSRGQFGDVTRGSQTEPTTAGMEQHPAMLSDCRCWSTARQAPSSYVRRPG